jgi:hypothetical protein
MNELKTIAEWIMSHTMLCGFLLLSLLTFIAIVCREDDKENNKNETSRRIFRDDDDVTPI